VTKRDGIAFNLAYVDDDFAEPHPDQFDSAYMNKLFEHARAQSKAGYAWRKGPPGFTEVGNNSRAAMLSAGHRQKAPTRPSGQYQRISNDAISRPCRAVLEKLLMVESNVQGRVVGMAVLGPRRRALGIPTSTIDRAVDQLLAKGHVFRGYLGAGLQPVKLGRPSNGAQPSGSGRGILVVSIDPDGPSARAGMLVGDIVTAWNGRPVDRVREVMGLLGPESVGSTVDLGLIRGGAPTSLKIVIGERPVT
jgi:PDZ domain